MPADPSIETQEAWQPVSADSAMLDPYEQIVSAELAQKLTLLPTTSGWSVVTSTAEPADER
jgi:hypothetical protein